jgi:hypothetical protein
MQLVRSRLPLLAVLFAMLVTLVSAEHSTSPTTDEHLHVTRGVAWWRAPDTRLSWPHPPLGHIIAGAPAAILYDGPPFEEIGGYDRANMPSVALRYFKSYEQARFHLRTARWVMIALALLLAAYLYEWMRRRYGPRLAFLSTLLYAADPVLLAHAGLMTTDFPVTLVTLFALLQLHDYLLSRSWRSFVGVMLALGGLVTAKLTGVLIALILLLPAILYAALGRGRFSGLTPKRRALFLGRDIIAATIVALLSVNAAYRFDDTGLTVAEIVEHQVPPGKFVKALHEDDLTLRAFPKAVPVPLPYTYLYSLEFVRAHNKRGHPSYFKGKGRSSGTHGYFATLLAAKLPSGMLVLLVAGVLLALKRRFSGLSLSVWLHAYFALAYFALTFNAHINIGVRHALPVVPSLAILAAHAANALWNAGRPGRLLTIGCLASVVLGTLQAHPRYIGDFNWLVGGRAGGHRLSVVGEDWGQDMNELADWQKREKVPVSYFHWLRLRYSELDYLGAKVDRWKCRSEPPADHWVAFHLSEKARNHKCVRHYAPREPDIVLNDHILLYGPAATSSTEATPATP